MRKNPKVYFIDTGLRNAIAGRFDPGDEEYGKLLENYLLNKMKDEKVNYWRTTAKAEVDFIINEKTPVESKITPKITRSFRSFIETYNPETAFLINMVTFEEHKINNTKMFIIPFALVG